MGKNLRNEGKKQNIKSILYLSGSLLGIALIAFIVTFVVYTNKLNRDANSFTAEKIADLVPNETETEEASLEIGKTVEESENSLETNLMENNTTSLPEDNTTSNSTISKKTEEKTNTNQTTKSKTQQETTTTTQEVADPEFIKPVEGEVVKKFASENLIYSETLKEWVTHYGIDILAPKTTMVKAAAEGTVTAIKNDPRYGTTVIIEHVNGFETRYSNLLTSEFVVVGEKVESGQSIGTVGNTAMFEVAEESHLHFELLKDSEALDPELYLK